MYKFLSASDSIMTRHVKLENCQTGKVELCFDDSDLRHDDQKDFWFMQAGNIYECKILLFGLAFDLFDDAMEQNRILCKTTARELIICEVVDSHLFVGTLEVISVVNNGNIYYISMDDIKNIKDTNRFAFRCSRKDLIQVDDVISPRYL